MYDLNALGFGPFFAEQLFSLSTTQPLIPARIAAEHRGAYEVWAAAGPGRAQLVGRLRRELPDEGLPGVGDWVLLRDPPDPDQPTVIEQVLARRTLFRRGAAGREARAQVVAANVDLVFVVCGLDEDFNVRRIERYLARIWASGARPEVVLNKADLCPEVADRVAEVERHALGVPVHVIAALHGQGLASLKAGLQEGLTVALVGSSGAGKSTLVNALLGTATQRTGAVRDSDGRGCHVTTQRQLILLPGGGLLLDTPGLRELRLLDEAGLEEVFADLEELARGCRYRDCRHAGEPGCALREAVDAGELDPDRLDHYRQLAREAEAYELRHDARRRKQAARVWGQLSHEVEQLRRWKGGKP